VDKLAGSAAFVVYVWVKLQTPICLTYHPANPPAPHEVIALAKLSATKSETP
jgi:hypothetical protein